MLFRFCLLSIMTVVLQTVSLAQGREDNLADESKNGTTTRQRVAPSPYAGPRHVIAVLPFENKVQGYGAASAALGEGMTEILITELVKSGRYVVVERDVLQSIVKEQELGMTGLVNNETAVKAGALAGAQFFIKGAVTEFNPKAGGGGISLGWDLGKVAAKAKTVYLGVDIRIVDNATGQIYASYSANAKARSRGGEVSTNITHSGEAFGLGLSGFSSTAVGKAVRVAIQDVMGFINTESSQIPWQGSIIKADSRRAFINRGKSSNINNGDRLALFAKGEPLIDPETGFNLGTDEAYLCDLVVQTVKDKFSIATVSQACQGMTITRGDLVRIP